MTSSYTSEGDTIRFCRPPDLTDDEWETIRENVTAFHAMNTSVAVSESVPVIECAPWCTLRPGHGWDSIHDDGRRSRGHGGPEFGPYISAGADEFADAPGVLEYVVQVHAEYVNITDPSELVHLASQARTAAQCLQLREVERAAAAACADLPGVRFVIELALSAATSVERRKGSSSPFGPRALTPHGGGSTTSVIGNERTCCPSRYVSGIVKPHQRMLNRSPPPGSSTGVTARSRTRRRRWA